MHQIRLRHPWQKRFHGQSETIRMDVPEAALDSQLPAAVSATYHRRFNRPPGLDDSARVWLRIEAWQGKLALLTLNDHPLPVTSPPLTCDVTDWLEGHNQLRLELTDTQDQRARLSGEVVLMIEETGENDINPQRRSGDKR